MASLESARSECKDLAIKHYGSTRFFNEEKMLVALTRRGYSEKIAADAIILTQYHDCVHANTTCSGHCCSDCGKVLK